MNNPVLSLDLRSRLRERRLWILALFLVAVPLVISLLCLTVSGIFTINGRDPFSDGGSMLGGIAVFSHGALLVLLSALGAAQRISQERERRTLPALINSPLPARRIADGKLLGAWAFTLWLAFTTLPFLAMASIWGGLAFTTLLLCWALNLAAALAAAALALGLSGLFGRSLSAYLATGAALFLWCAVVPAIGLFTIAGSSAGPDLWSKTILPSLFFYHLPLAPQVMVFAAEGTKAFPVAPIVSALVVWPSLALFGRHLAIRGLRREVY